MRIRVEIETESEYLPIDYRRKILSFVKKAFEDYDAELFSALYEDGHSTKSLCFAVYFVPEVTVDKDGVSLGSRRLVLWITSVDVLMGVHLVNIFMNRRNRWFPLADCDNKLKVVSITKVKEYPIMDTTVNFKTLSPIIIRDSNKKNNKDWYLTFDDEGFQEIWKRNLISELQHTFGRDVTADIAAMQLKPIRLKKTVVKSYGIYIPCTTGSFMLEGEKYLLEYLYKAGLGSKRALGFGCLDIL